MMKIIDNFVVGYTTECVCSKFVGLAGYRNILVMKVIFENLSSRKGRMVYPVQGIYIVGKKVTKAHEWLMIVCSSTMFTL